MITSAVGTAFWWALYVLMFRRERRRVRNGLLLLVALHSSIWLVAELVATTVPGGDLLVLAAVVLAVPGVLALGVFLLWNGVTMVRREGRSLGSLLSGLVGIALFAAPALSVLLALLGGPVGYGGGVLLALLSLHLGLAFLVFLGASVPYQLFPARLPATAVIVHGSGLVRGRVSPLLRSRLDRAVAERERLLGLGIDPVLVPSGGRGADEPRAEGEAMAEYLVQEAGVPPDRVLAETASRTTEENLAFSHRLLAEAGHEGPYLVSTSRYHAFRAALLARSLGFADEAIGGPTRFYYVPSATVREFIAVLSYRRVWFVLAFAPSALMVALVVRAALIA